MDKKIKGLLECKSAGFSKKSSIRVRILSNPDDDFKRVFVCWVDQKTADKLAKVLRKTARRSNVSGQHAYELMECYACIKEGENVTIKAKWLTKSIVNWFKAYSDELLDALSAGETVSWKEKIPL